MRIARIHEAITAERRATIAYLREKMAEVAALSARGRMPAHEAEQLNRRLDAVADGIATGLHVQ